ncbi:double zinc ribbon and ankyrin repeat-containing protein 1 isoform X3 [Oryzias melastigma]|uniref:double zinc ribbon and ankyrin repeat-containing protein 1 isoform X3 n=1 Tax=Oryzias melastigma TaxID=30732 RepID=UPI00168D34EB|nr:double zinc ribbon and ankyrin repeat-containing protein 1 isoform X3 [Oryzias melastigma]
MFILTNRMTHNSRFFLRRRQWGFSNIGPAHRRSERPQTIRSCSASCRRVAMAAGVVSAPLIIPIIHLKTSRGKTRIDTRTPVSMQSDTAGALIFFTLDGSKPLDGRGGSAGSSRKYSKPILLPSGRVHVKAVAVTSDSRQSSVVTKVFVVDPAEDGDLQNLQQLFQDLPVGTCSSEKAAGDPQPASELRLFNPLQRSRPPPSCPQSAVNKVGPERSGAETDLRCAQCLWFGPSDPMARFCAHCGAPSPAPPGQTLPPAEPEQCVCCDSPLPVNAHTCLVCEEPALFSRARQVLCVSCGRGNPPDICRCLTCESFLSSTPAAQVRGGALGASCRMITCSRCKWENRSDARFCNFCGSKTAAPQKATPSSDPAPSLKVTQPTADKSTQTVGLHYPSFLELQRRLQTKAQQGPRDPQPPLTAVSPGRGFWRKQLDHVCGHLRSYAQNNPPFRALLGEPRFGRVLSAVIQEEQLEVSLTLSFASGGQNQQAEPEGDPGGPAGPGPGPASPAQTLSSVTERSRDGVNGSEQTSDVLRLHMEHGRAVPDSQLGLLKELGPGGGRISTVQRLLDQGADPSRCGSDGRHLLAVAVMNGHPDVLPVLLQRGADADQQSGPMKNTALHEAAALGSAGLQSAAVLLRCKASVRRRNAVGQTPYDVAASSGCGDMVSLLAAGTGPGSPGRSRLSTDGYQPLGRGQGFSV